MKQATLISPGNIVFSEVGTPTELGDNDVLINIKKIGICGSDINVMWPSMEKILQI